jgi:hypothetical protein
VISLEPSLHGVPVRTIDRQEPGEAIRSVDHARAVVVHDEAGRSHAAADRSEPVVAQGHFQVPDFDNGVGDA